MPSIYRCFDDDGDQDPIKDPSYFGGSDLSN